MSILCGEWSAFPKISYRLFFEISIGDDAIFCVHGFEDER
ncbi:hypothetical protein Enr13x_21640 [Stieleria neptunia]|uniref:Uncharacterized protein n=1 Tax=Stieleria neptunia TaxID=2527979 RepID=A0A518HND3_9BACT|nr:hypothetical protein Enr13x_21640 [Stieleria neptunia]